MAVSLVGNITYINQNAQAGSTQLANAQGRPDIIQESNKNEFERKLQEVAQVSGTEDSQAINENGRNKQEQQRQEQAKKQWEIEQKEDKKPQEYYYDGMLNVKA